MINAMHLDRLTIGHKPCISTIQEPITIILIIRQAARINAGKHEGHPHSYQGHELSGCRPETSDSLDSAPNIH